MKTCYFLLLLFPPFLLNPNGALWIRNNTVASKNQFLNLMLKDSQCFHIWIEKLAPESDPGAFTHEPHVLYWFWWIMQRTPNPDHVARRETFRSRLKRGTSLLWTIPKTYIVYHWLGLVSHICLLLIWWIAFLFLFVPPWFIAPLSHFWLTDLCPSTADIQGTIFSFSCSTARVHGFSCFLSVMHPLPPK